MPKAFLIEIGSEELPPNALVAMAKALSEHITSGVKAAELAHGEVRWYATPRRLAVWIDELQEKQKDKVIEKRGPAVAAAFDEEGNPTKATLGFARSCGVEDVIALQRLKTDKGEWLSYQVHQTGQSVQHLLPTIVNQAIKKLPIPKLMKWGSGDTQFARPVHWVVMLYGDTVIEGEVLGHTAGRTTYGHRFHHPAPINLVAPSNYLDVLEQAKVLACFDTRKQTIAKQIKQCVNSVDAVLVEDDDLLDEVTAIVEWPVAVLVGFDERFLDVPKEALIASMKGHQKCFSLMAQDGRLLPYFITIANIESEAPEHIIQGNEKVMRARLSDAAFFYQKDKATTLEEKCQALGSIVFQEQLGSMADKVARISSIATTIANALGHQTASVERAAKLSKASLLTGMVGEFPELQDVMGYYYALHDGEPSEIAVALKESYLPRYAGDVLPQSEVGITLALAERLDTLVGIFGIGQKPTGMKDPFQLRRNALGVIRILVENACPLSLTDLLEWAIVSFDGSLSNPDVKQEVHQFILDRMYGYLTQTYRPDVVKAVLAVHQNRMDHAALMVKALSDYVSQSEHFVSLAQGFKRVRNILKKLKDESLTFNIDPALFTTEQEKMLYDILSQSQTKLSDSLAKQEYAQSLSVLTSFKAPVDMFMEEIRINVEDIKIQQNRQALLMALSQLFLSVADISLLQVAEQKECSA